MDNAERWADTVERLTERPDVTPGKMFGCAGLRLGTKFFAMVWHDRLVVKLPEATAAQVLAQGGEPFEPMPGRRMGGWVVPGPAADWIALAEAARTYLAELTAS